ncbi:MAG: glutaredoxin family protein [Patescibacteria group bacterium]
MAEVNVYTTPTCTYCNMLKNFLNEKGVEYRAIDVSEDAQARDHIVEASGQMGVPVTEIKSSEGGEAQYIVGFDEVAISQVLGL